MLTDKNNYPLSNSRIKRLVSRSIELSNESHNIKNYKTNRNVIAIRFTGNYESKKLNNSYRKKNYPTNVLTFSYEVSPQIIADILICIPVAKKESRVKKIKLDQHVAHLIVHGVLHAAGHDHKKEIEAAKMEQLEIMILKRFRITNPYLKK